MAIIFRTRKSIIKTLLSSPSILIPYISSSPFSTLGRQHLRPIGGQTPPVAKKVPFTVSAHGKSWVDPYHWMRNPDDPDFITYLQQENSYAEAFMEDTHKLQKTLYTEMISRMPSTIFTPPERWGPWFVHFLKPVWLYYQYIPEGKEFPILCRKLAANSKGWMGTIANHIRSAYKKEDILLDWNEIAENYGYVHVGTCRVSPDHNFLAYTIDISGGEEFVLQIKDLQSDCILPNLNINGVVYFINATKTGLKKFCNRVSGVQYFLEHHHGYFYVLTNAPIIDDMALPESGNFYLARCRVENSQSTNLQNIIVPSGDIFLKDMDMFNEHLVLFVNKEGSSSICSIPMKTIVSCEKQKDIEDLSPWFFPLPSDMCSVAPGSNHDFMNSIYRVIVSSPVMPDVIVDYDMSRKSSNVVMQEELTNISSRNDNGLEDRQGCEIQKTEGHIWRDVSGIYACESKEVISHDGVRIPLTILYSRKAHQKGQSPALLHAYGAYGEILDKSWCGNRLSLLDRGWAIAFADVRGGGGGPHPSWHRSGSGLNKLNSIRDFISCGQYLVNEGYAHGNKLGAAGISAGSLLVGAAIGLHPGLFQAAVLKVPFLDICNTLLDPTLPLTILDYEEFGNPQIESYFNYILKYSPYDNISHELCFPATLVTASYNDSRVGVWEAAKWVAKIRDKACSKCCGSVILQTDMNGGHFSEGGRLGHCQEAAYEYAFLMKAMGDLQRDETRSANEVFGI
nr:Oligopeptidase B, putative [Ipomoea batatas]